MCLYIEDTDEQCYTIWHFFIDKTYQGKGYGKEAIKRVIDLIEKEPPLKTNKIALTVEDENTVAKKLYESVGFYDTNERDEDNEIIMMKNI
ncbi:GNAT family N-acetyltransferase [Carnobacterium divergens]|uniref:N-acetyltransferase domain-containing protein n=1 Tax=Carnobacterium divergens DSM 20623 TaxID=1449336 RepID=A0A0R2I8Z4_CARDV|nr:GNAT family N-acetyltransferase [Carnobacterium divergens]KRN57853.1 hypothetical protein IV74_GL001108 [Carnobacterium divergens DSM 20623]MDO0874484.1 GNAT family N-acetyltransferase [Carnobacterium divergens]SUX22105.1 Spermine/spermidine acetyltransferase [Carnobacterium divergens]